LKSGLKISARQGCLQILNRRDRRRYLAVLCSTKSNDDISFINLIKKRNSELFGHIANEKSSIRLVYSDKNKNIIIISCKLQNVDNVLSAIALTSSPLVVLDMSGTLKRLKSRLLESSV
jgi:RNase P/RNase MRP subunit POP5